MTRKTMTPERYQEIKRLLNMGVSVRKICQSVKATKRTIQAIRDGNIPDPAKATENTSDSPPVELASTMGGSPCQRFR